MSEPLDIVIPVFRGEAETRACLASVLAAARPGAHEIVVVDDASPEPAIPEWLRSLAREGRITLLAHAGNRGFVASVNEAMALHPARDVILLNSDTEVAPGWAERIAAHLAADPALGTVTPFSNNATLCSYPRTLAANALPPGETTASLDAAFAAANAGRRVDIPTAVGFCMAIRRACLDRVGPFDAERYGTGYGEEVDFCMRAARAGFRHALAGDVFVRHVGEVSFQATGAERRVRAQALVDQLYPEFQQRLADFIPADPPRMLRRRADLQRLRGHAEAVRIGRDGGLTRLDWPHPGEEFVLWLETARDGPALEQLLAALRSATLRLPEIEPRWLAKPPVYHAEAPAAPFSDTNNRP
ncbi:MAG TPA: glycosyltransferase [Usitatibacter sp.]|nr:glycosyltransferase [Usitatibacter sp.]